MNHFGVLLSLLRDRPTFWDDIRRNIKVERKSLSLLVASCIFFAIYGAIIGSSSSWMQMLSSAIKLPALYLITLAICLPTLFFFDVLFGSKLGFGQYVALLLTGMATISVLLFSFAPITLFFLISIHDYNFFLLVNVLIFALTGLIGIRLFYSGMQQLSYTSKVIKPAPSRPSAYDDGYGDRYQKPYEIENPKRDRQEDPALSVRDVESISEPAKDSEDPRQERRDRLMKLIYDDDYDESSEIKPSTRDRNDLQSTSIHDFEPISDLTKRPDDDLHKMRDRLLKFWLFLYALVGSQLGWTLRPFFGAPNEPFQLFRPIEGNFYSTIFQVLLNFLGLS
jgi:hypothetical protein